MAKTYSILDIASGGYIGLRAMEIISRKQGYAQLGTDMSRAFGFYDPASGSFTWQSSLKTYAPPVAMQIAKKVLNKIMSKPIRIGPLRFP
jgi:hypothetical protein